MLAAGLASLAVAGDALAGAVRGRLSGQEKLFPDVYAEAAKSDAHRYTWREPSPTVRSDFFKLTANPSRDICIGAFTSAQNPAHEPILIRVTGGHTIPTTIVITPGTRLSFENRDPFVHRLYAVGNDQWSAQDLTTSAHREWTATGAGVYEFRDQLFPSVRTYIVVDPQVSEVAYPGAQGAFGMNLSDGEYTLKAFFQGKQVGRAVNVVVKGRPIDLKDPFNVAEGG
jgi:plastocyanin